MNIFLGKSFRIPDKPCSHLNALTETHTHQCTQLISWNRTTFCMFQFGKRQRGGFFNTDPQQTLLNRNPGTYRDIRMSFEPWTLLNLVSCFFNSATIHSQIKKAKTQCVDQYSFGPSYAAISDPALTSVNLKNHRGTRRAHDHSKNLTDSRLPQEDVLVAHM